MRLSASGGGQQSYAQAILTQLIPKQANLVGSHVHVRKPDERVDVLAAIAQYK